jgi:hypothetical protein
MGEVRQNTSGHSIIYNGTEVKELDLYGTFNGVVFVSRPFIAMKTGFMPMFIKTSMGWVSIHPCKIVSFIKEAYHARSVSLYDWNAYQQSKKEKRLVMEKAKQQQSETAFLRASQANAEGSLRYHKSKKRLDDRYNEAGKPTQKKRSQCVVFGSSEYITVSGWIYGKEVLMNNHSFRMDERMSYYMDGTGCCARDFDNRDMRPLNDVFPVKSGKKAR